MQTLTKLFTVCHGNKYVNECLKIIHGFIVTYTILQYGGKYLIIKINMLSCNSYNIVSSNFKISWR